jgi:hypothetical protein
VFDVQQATPGEWAVVAAGSRALLVAEPDASRLRGYLDAVASGFAETLDALVARGLSRTPGFALLDASAETVLLAVRGPATARVTADGHERSVHATSVSSWVEVQLSDAAEVALGAGAGTDALPLIEGIVRASGLGWRAAERDDEVGATVAAPPKRERDTGPVEGLASREPASTPESASAPEPESAAVELPLDPHTRVPEATLADVSVAPAGNAAVETSGYDHLFGATMVRSVEDAAVRPEDEEAAPPLIDLPGFITDSFPASAGRREGDHDGMTVLSGDLPPRPRTVEADADLPEPEPAPAPPTFTVLLSDGRREALVAPVVVGRAPSPSAAPALRNARPVTLTSAEDDISRSHVAVAVEGDSVVVTDLHSRNGTLVVLPGKSPQKLRSGEPTTVVLGTVIDLGSGATLTVEAGE